jgi:hypothetical protein
MAVERPARVTITNVDSPSLEFMEAQFNPDEVKERLSASYARLKVLGEPHEEMQYEGTANHELKFDLNFDAFALHGAGRFGVRGASGIEDARRFIHSFFYPPSAAMGVASGGPPRLLFDWPEMWAMVTSMPSVDMTHRLFAASGASTLFTASITLEERRTFRLPREDVLAHGTRRAR